MSHDESSINGQSEKQQRWGVRCIQVFDGPPKPPSALQAPLATGYNTTTPLVPTFLPQDTTPRAFVTEFNPSPPSPLGLPGYTFKNSTRAPASRPFSRPSYSSGSLSNSIHHSNGLADSSPWSSHSFSQHQLQDHSFSSLAPPLECIPSVSPYSQSFDTFTSQESDLWAEPHLSIANTDWNFLPIDPPALYTSGFDSVHVTVNDGDYGVPSTFGSLSESGSNEPRPLPPSLIPSPSNSQDGYSHASPVSQIPGSVSTSLSSPATSQGDDVLTRVDSSRVEKRRMNTLAARRCRQRRVDRMKSLEDELEAMRRERDELRLKVSKLEGETEALKGLLTRKSK
ncbi:uncharacterized protein N7496_007205 [Penicillium cataractarum]|uniref:BZIP domain-containing protein n=1 Tax=Penicillium cataractarum TaxID=2100454 RepID=A0A9W9S7N3_9EURO|nr:uncharacterized protein N7496_007205 [Penicillium cataractarum]KAJ5371113.1 hypothetical protein N7496_007205 [Penicillium cataractarum]